MLPLKPFVNALQDALRYSDCFVRAYAFFDRCLEHHYTWLILKEVPDGLGVEVPEFRHFAGCIMALRRGGRFGQRARKREWSRHSYLSPLSLLSLSGAGLGG